MSETSEILNPLQASKILGYTQQWVTELLRKGKLRGQRVGKLWIVTRDDVLAYKAEAEAKQETQAE